MSTHRIAYYKGKPFWSGAINRLDKTIEEVHPFSDALAADFHHSFYFNHPEKIFLNDGEEGENVFFFITEDKDGKSRATTEWRVRGLKDLDHLEKYLNNSGILEFDDNDYDDDNKVVVLNKNVIAGLQH